MSTDKVLLGLRRLHRKTKPGQTHRLCDIAKECNVSEGAIRKIEKQAIERLRKKLAGCSEAGVEALRVVLNA